MGRYLARRFVFSLLSLVLLIAFGFFLVRFIPGNPFLQEESLDPLIAQQMIRESGLDQPLFSQYLNYVGELFKGNLGYSLDSPSTKVVTLIVESFHWTLKLGLSALAVSILCSLAIGVFVSGQKKGQGVFESIALLVFCMPALVAAPIFISVFSLHLGWLPISRVDSWTGWILPVIVVALRPTFKLSRVLVDEMRRVLAGPSVRTLKSLGYDHRTIRSAWVLRESMVGYIAYLGVVVVDLVGGSLLVEVLFGIPGTGFRLADAISARDYLVLSGLILVLGTLVLMIQMVVDLLICWIDPRVRL